MKKPIIGTGKDISPKAHMSKIAKALSEGFPGGTPGPSNIVSKGFSKYLAEGHSYGMKKSGGPAKPITGALGSETRRAEYDAKGWKYDHTIAGDHEGSYKPKKKEGGTSTKTEGTSTGTGESSVKGNTGEGKKKKEAAQKKLDATKDTAKSNRKDRQAARSAKRKEKRTKRITKREEIRQGRQKAKDEGLKGKAKREAIKAAKKEAKKKQKA